MTATLAVTAREARGKANEKLRRDGKIPAVLYGPKQEPVALSLDKVTFEKTLRDEGESSIYTLTGLDDKKEVLIHEVAFDAARGGVTHVDFYAIEKGKELNVDVPLEFVGEPPALKLGGTLTKVLHEVAVTCAPGALPKHIEVDTATLMEIEDSIQVKDLVVPEGVTITNDPEDVIALVQTVEEEVEETTGGEVDMDAIAVEEKGKKEDADESES